jgi:ATP-dependent clp protease adaptor protein clpS
MNNAVVTLSSGTLTEGDTDLTTELENILAADTPWNVIVWNDPVNLMTYVSYVFRSHFGYSRARAEELMLQVHHNGKAIVFTGPREDAEKHTQAMHAWGLLATFEKVEN